MITIEVLRDCVLTSAAQAQGRALITEIQSSPQGDCFELRCVDSAEHYARLAVAVDTADDVTITLGLHGIAEYDHVSVDDLKHELAELTRAVINGRVSEVRQVSADGELLASTTTAMINGEPYAFHYRIAFRRRKDARRVEIQYSSYLE